MEDVLKKIYLITFWIWSFLLGLKYYLSSVNTFLNFVLKKEKNWIQTYMQIMQIFNQNNYFQFLNVYYFENLKAKNVNHNFNY